MAVNSAKFMQGNSFSNARSVLRQYQQEVKEWKPPPVKLLSAATEWDRLYEDLSKQERAHEVFDYQTRDQVRKEMNDKFYNTVQPKLAIANRGTQLVQETIGTQADRPVEDNYLTAYYESNREKQKLMGTTLYTLLERENVNLNNYGVDFQSLNLSGSTTSIDARSTMMRQMLRAAFSIGAVVDLERIFKRKIPESEATALSPRPQLPSIYRIKQQGVPEATTAPLTPEIERK